MMFPWTDEQIETLKSLWAAGLSCNAIGRKLGCSKNAVVGKAHRLKLQQRRNPNHPSHLITARLRAREAAKQSAAASAFGASLLELEPSMCRWPIGQENGQHRFCGHAKREEGPYCATHAALAYIPAPKRMRDSPRQTATGQWIEAA
jgi:GcrA cell cycle regulator